MSSSNRSSTSSSAAAERAAAAATESSGVVLSAVVEQNYVPSNQDELCLRQGQNLVILARTNSFGFGYIANMPATTAAWFPLSHIRLQKEESTINAGDAIELTPEDYPRIVGGKILRAHHEYRAMATDEMNISPGQHILAIETSEDGWLLGITDPGAWLAILQAQPLMLHVGVNIGWLPANHTAPTDLHMARLLRSPSKSVGATNHNSGAQPQPGSGRTKDKVAAAAQDTSLDNDNLMAAWRQASLGSQKPGKQQHQQPPQPEQHQTPQQEPMSPLAASLATYDNMSYNTRSKEAPKPVAPAAAAATTTAPAAAIPAPYVASQPAPPITAVSASAEQRLKNTVIALYDCKAEAADELDFERGDILVLTRRDILADWWEGHSNNATPPIVSKLIPKGYVRDLDAHEYGFLRSMLPRTLVRPSAIEPTPEKEAPTNSHLYEDIAMYANVKPSGSPIPSPTLTAPPMVFEHNARPARPAPPPPRKSLAQDGAEDHRTDRLQLPLQVPKRTHSIGRRPHGRSRKSAVSQAGKPQSLTVAAATEADGKRKGRRSKDAAPSNHHNLAEAGSSEALSEQQQPPFSREKSATLGRETKARPAGPPPPTPPRLPLRAAAEVASDKTAPTASLTSPVVVQPEAVAAAVATATQPAVKPAVPRKPIVPPVPFPAKPATNAAATPTTKTKPSVPAKPKAAETPTTTLETLPAPDPSLLENVRKRAAPTPPPPYTKPVLRLTAVPGGSGPASGTIAIPPRPSLPTSRSQEQIALLAQQQLQPQQPHVPEEPIDVPPPVPRTRPPTLYTTDEVFPPPVADESPATDDHMDCSNSDDLPPSTPVDSATDLTTPTTTHTNNNNSLNNDSIRGIPSLPSNQGSPRTSRRGAPLPATVVTAYTAANEDELTLAVGDVVFVTLRDEKEAWWVGRLPSLQEGRFPRECVSLQPRSGRSKLSTSVESEPGASLCSSPLSAPASPADRPIVVTLRRQLEGKSGTPL